MAQLLGKDAKFYLLTANLTVGTMPTAVTGTIVGNITDLDLSMEVEETDTTTRETAALGWATTETTLKKATISFTMMWKPGDTNFDDIREAFIDNTEVGAAALDQLASVTGAQGLVANYKVTKFQKGEKLKEAQTVAVEMKPSSFPNWFKKAA